MIKASIALKEEKLRPLDGDQIEIASADGIATAKVLFGDCMQSFRETVTREEKALAALWKEWSEVQQELEEFAKEMLGPDGLTQVRNSEGSALGGQCGEQQKKLKQDVELDTTRLEEEIEKIGQQAMQKMLASEKVRYSLSIVTSCRGCNRISRIQEMDFLQRKQRKGILSMWEAQL